MCCNQKTFSDTVIGCQDIRVNAVLLPNTEYVWEVTTRFNNKYLLPFTTDSQGYGTIDVSQLPEGFCVPGECFDLKLKQSVEACEYVGIPLMINHERLQVTFAGGSMDKSFIGCPYTIPVSGGTFVSHRIQFTGEMDQTVYQDDDLIDAVQLIVVNESGVLQEGDGIMQYQFDASTGTITFGQTVEGQNITLISFK